MKIGNLLEVARLHGSCENHGYTPDTDIRDVRQEHITWAEKSLPVSLPAGAFAMSKEGYGCGYGGGAGNGFGCGDGDGYGDCYGHDDDCRDGYGFGINYEPR